MKNNFPYLKDKDFLKEIDNMKIKEQFVKITILDFQERPIQDIQGKVISGNINIDGKSSVRRTCNLNLIADDESAEKINAPSNLISLNKKVEVKIGFKNTLMKYKDYDIIWFPLGIYVIVGCSITHNTNGVNLNLQLKDKMCLLNGEVGGIFPASVVFNEYDVDTSFIVELESSHAIPGGYDNGTSIIAEDTIKIESDGNYSLFREEFFKAESKTEIFQPTIYQIIQEVVNHFGGEQLGKIIINDIPLRTKMVMKWIGSQPLYGCSKFDRDKGPDNFFILHKSVYDNIINN